ncbi:hypothetical protein CSKR_200740, partial [Clonorchis sinensis]
MVGSENETRVVQLVHVRTPLQRRGVRHNSNAPGLGVCTSEFGKQVLSTQLGRGIIQAETGLEFYGNSSQMRKITWQKDNFALFGTGLYS